MTVQDKVSFPLAEDIKIDIICALVHLSDISSTSCLQFEHSNMWGL